MYTNEDKTWDILRVTIGVSIGLMISKYTTMAFNFQVPTMAASLVLGTDKVTVKKVIKSYWWLVGFAALGLLCGEVFRNNKPAMAVVTFGFIFTAFFFTHINPNGIRSAVLGYSFTTVYATYTDKNVETMVGDLVIVVIIGGLLGWAMLTIFPKKIENKKIPVGVKPQREHIHKNITNTLLVSIIIFLIWGSFMIFNIRGAFFAYATLAGIYGNLSLEKIHKLSPLNIAIHVCGCFIAIVFSFLMDGRSLAPAVFFMGLMLLFYPIVYMGVYGDSPKKRAFFMGLVRAIILPIALYMTPDGDIVQQASARAIQISLMVMGSMVITRILLKLQEVNSNGKNTGNNRENQ
ncbi:DUF2955 domain-containing protein [Cetobacterium sp. SF1]|uniref:DUF2955 domain-containing protein n=1 Tax=Cetobacterium sp. SF1 TaxID=3417654 RepID=UPI003CE9CBB2